MTEKEKNYSAKELITAVLDGQRNFSYSSITSPREERAGFFPEVVDLTQVPEYNAMITYLRTIGKKGHEENPFNFERSTFNGVIAPHLYLPFSRWSYAQVMFSHLPKAYFHKARMLNTELDKTNLSNSDLSEAKLQGASLEHTNLQNSTLDLTNIQCANLFRANLRGAKDLGLVIELENALLAEIKVDEEQKKIILEREILKEHHAPRLITESEQERLETQHPDPIRTEYSEKISNYLIGKLFNKRKKS